MKPIIAGALLSIFAAGCGGPIARLDKAGRIQAVVLTDAHGLSGRAGAIPPIQVADPDRIEAVEAFLKARHSRWEKSSGTPRAMRFQLQLIGDGQPLYTVWFEPGFAQGTAGGKDLREMRLSNGDLAELCAALGLPPEYHAIVASASTVDLGPPHSGIVKGPRGK